jgi:acetate kinase
VKYSFYDGGTLVASGMIERLDDEPTLTTHTPAVTQHRVCAGSFEDAGRLVLEQLGRGVTISKFIHRVVHGGMHDSPQRITNGLISDLEGLTPLAPLHMPGSIALIRFFTRVLPHAAHVACFDTMFHRTMPAVASTYALPRHLVDKHRIHRYGFHGLAHEHLAQEAAKRMKRPLGKLRIITCQLGNGVSVCAVKGGKSVDTSMGFTPLEGVVMGTRSGSIDPAILPFLTAHERYTTQELLELLETKSGLLAIGGHADVRDLLRKEKTGDAGARLALDLLVYQVKKHIGAYAFAMGGVDCIALGGGISQSPVMRKRIMDGLGRFGIIPNAKTIGRPAPTVISTGRVRVFALITDEERHMLALCKHL